MADPSASASPENAAIRRIFLPYMDRKLEEATTAGTRFVYYTSAETATNILRYRQIWMRDATIMNDYMEVEYGFGCLNAAYRGDVGARFREALDAYFPGLAEELQNDFNAWLPAIRRDTYMTCVSEHLADEDQHGRLSMWRAYGGRAGVALVINGGPMLRESHALRAYASPVAYLSEEALAEEWRTITAGIAHEAAYIRTLTRETVKRAVFNAFRFATVSTKHPGFREEREWRIVASPEMYPSRWLVPGVEVVRGIPQTVLKIDLQDHPDKDVVGLTLPDLLDRIIIGPCEFPQVISRAFHRLLVDAGVPAPDAKVVVSDIPLRHL